MSNLGACTLNTDTGWTPLLLKVWLREQGTCSTGWARAPNHTANFREAELTCKESTPQHWVEVQLWQVTAALRISRVCNYQGLFALMLFTSAWLLLQQCPTFGLRPRAPHEGLELRCHIPAVLVQGKPNPSLQGPGAAGAAARAALAPACAVPPWGAAALPHLRAQLLCNVTSWATQPTALHQQAACHCVRDPSAIQSPICVAWRQTNRVSSQLNAVSCLRYWAALPGRLH